MAWNDPSTWFSSKPSTPAASTGAAPAPLGTYPPATTATGPYGGRSRRRRTRSTRDLGSRRGGRKSSRRSRSGRKSTRS